MLRSYNLNRGLSLYLESEGFPLRVIQNVKRDESTPFLERTHLKQIFESMSVVNPNTTIEFGLAIVDNDLDTFQGENLAQRLYNLIHKKATAMQAFFTEIKIIDCYVMSLETMIVNEEQTFNSNVLDIRFKYQRTS